MGRCKGGQRISARENSISTDVCIVAAGIAGLSVSSHELSKRGREVVVVDDGTPGCGENSENYRSPEQFT